MMKKFLLTFGLCLLSAAMLWAADKDEKTELEKRRDTLQYGLESEITDMINTFIKEEDYSFSKELYAAFEATNNTAIRESCIEYFTRAKDDRLEDYALEILEDPYDTKTSTVNKLISYCAEVGIQSAAPLIMQLLDDESEDYLDAGLRALGSIGGAEEAAFLADYLDRDLTTARRQTLMKSLGGLKVTSTWDKLVEVARDEDENLYVRMYATEAIGAMELKDSVPVLMELFESSEPNVREYAIKGLSYYNSHDISAFMIEAFRDNYYKVRIEAAKAVQKWTYRDALDALIYRAQNDGETAVKNACYDAIGALNVAKGNEFLIGILKDKKKGDSTRAKAATVLLINGDRESVAAVCEVAKEVAVDKQRKNLRYAIGKEMAKHKSSQYEEVCLLFLESDDASTVGTGLDIWKTNRYGSCRSKVQEIADREKKTAITKKAALILETAD
ncbi:MAG: HEAT repeat domain-containing protein [Treponemataceae bacterium]|nr:HEAT repeat domain-containing protein [Treponemataceae bacterium]